MADADYKNTRIRTANVSGEYRSRVLSGGSRAVLEYTWSANSPTQEYNKLSARKIGHVEVIEKINPNAYCLKLPSHIHTSDVLNVKHLVPFAGDNSSEDETGADSRANRFQPMEDDEDEIALAFLSLSTNSDNSKIEDDAPDEEDDGQRRRKRPKKVPNKGSLDHSGIYQSHPLKIALHVNDDEISDLKSAKLITLKFEFLIKLNVVCVGVEDSEENAQNNILCNLFPDDTGLELPQQSAKLLLGNSLSFDVKRTLRPYKWAQHLAGIDVLPDVSPRVSASEESNSETAKDASITSGLSLYRQQNRVQTVVQRIRDRKKSQLVLVYEVLRGIITKSTHEFDLKKGSLVHEASPEGEGPGKGPTTPTIRVYRGQAFLCQLNWQKGRSSDSNLWPALTAVPTLSFFGKKSANSQISRYKTTPDVEFIVKMASRSTSITMRISAAYEEGIPEMQTK
ncbi:hypothetical protein OROGR_026290 [Orobanche gracilis]